ncbi:MAG: DUF1566 domain-containing protein [Phycisphaerae bacterium]
MCKSLGWLPVGMSFTLMILISSGCDSSETLGSRVEDVNCDSCASCCAVEGASLSPLATGQVDSFAEGDDGNFEFGTAAGEDRFVSCSRGTMLDSSTGLMWLGDASCILNNAPDFETDGIPDGRLAWDEALRFVDEMNAGLHDTCSLGFTDWRLPNARELETLVNSGETAPNEWLMDQGFNLFEANTYWTSTTFAGRGETLAFVVDFESGALLHAENKSRVASSLLPVRQVCPDGTASVAATGQIESFADGDDGSSQVGISLSGARFVENGDGTVTDELTGLMWLRDAGCQGSGSWEQAIAAATSFNRNRKVASCEGYSAVHTDWRVPNRRELMTLVDFSQHEPVLPADHPFVGVDTVGGFWTSTSFAANADLAWFVDMATGSIEDDAKGSRRNIWLVRTAD